MRKKSDIKSTLISILICKGTWECKDGATDVDFRNWGDGEPSNGEPAENCGKLWDGSWGDIPCYWSNPAVCKQPVA